MLDYAIKNITNAADYVNALSLYNRSTPLTEEQVEALLSLYVSYTNENITDREYARFFLAVDLLPECAGDDFTELDPVGLTEPDRSALLRLREIVSGPEWTPEEAQTVVDSVQGGTLSEPMQVALARGALDAMVRAYNYLELRGQIVALAEFLIGCGTSTLDKYTVLVREVYQKCRS